MRAACNLGTLYGAPTIFRFGRLKELGAADLDFQIPGCTQLVVCTKNKFLRQLHGNP